jgi:hypothetical protein
MPYILKNRQSGEIAAAMLRNTYDFDYFGTKWWETEEEAADEKEAFLLQWQYKDIEDWDVCKVEDTKVKTLNVKLKNNPAYLVIMDEAGRVTAKLREE